MLHFPETLADTETARRRLALDEFVELQVQIQRRRRNIRDQAPRRCRAAATIV